MSSQETEGLVAAAEPETTEQPSSAPSLRVRLALALLCEILGQRARAPGRLRTYPRRQHAQWAPPEPRVQRRLMSARAMPQRSDAGHDAMRFWSQAVPL